jgi:hypothetical protein
MRFFCCVIFLAFSFFDVFSQTNEFLFKVLELKGAVKRVEIKNISEMHMPNNKNIIYEKEYDTIVFEYHFNEIQQLTKAYRFDDLINVFYNKDTLILKYTNNVNRTNWIQKYIGFNDTLFFDEQFTRLQGVDFIINTKYFFNQTGLLCYDKTMLLNGNNYEVEKCIYYDKSLEFELIKDCITEDYFRKVTPLITPKISTYRNLAFDNRGNWIKREKIISENESEFEIRTIEYY